MTSARDWLTGLRTPTGRRGAILAAGPALIVVLVAVAVLWSSHSAAAGDRLVVSTQGVELRLGRILQRLTDAETGQRGYLLTGDDGYLAPYRGASSDVRQDLNALRRMTVNEADQARRVGVLAGIVERKFTELDSTIVLRRLAGPTAARVLVGTDRGRILMDSARLIAADIERTESNVLAAQRRAVDRQRSFTEALVIVGAGLIAMIGILVHALLESQRAAVAGQNVRLRDQATELDHQNQQLAEQAIELEHQASAATDQAIELEAQNEELEAMNRALDTARADAEAANETKAKFLATMSHELRTPLNAISGYVDLMLAGVRGPITAQQASDLGRMRHSSVYLLGLINNVLNFAKLEAGQVDVSEGVIDVCETVHGATIMVEPLAAAKGITVSGPDSTDTNLAAYADRDKVVQIVLNLLGNAIKFTNIGGAVVVDCGLMDEWVTITVQDTGRGIAPHQLKTIFEPFVQVGRARLESEGGVGLGLAISRDLARRMGGDITATSIEGVGSTFQLRLRRATNQA